MLPKILTNESRRYQDDENWRKYLADIGGYANTIDHAFLSQICYEHSFRFNDYFPRFNINKSKIYRIKLSSKEIYEQIKYDKNQELDFWYFQVDNYLENLKLENYSNLTYTIEHGTWSFPPVVIKSDLAKKLGSKEYGKPIHLIEGTHRISFVRRLYELNRIKDIDLHELILIDNK